jgi:hypothetical protein
MIRAALDGDDGTHERIADYLRDAVVELETWRQNARTAQERQALQRVTTLLSMASAEIRNRTRSADPGQHALHLAGTVG